jgi:hypothetical protein
MKLSLLSVLFVSLTACGTAADQDGPVSGSPPVPDSGPAVHDGGALVVSEAPPDFFFAPNCDGNINTSRTAICDSLGLPQSFAFVYPCEVPYISNGFGRILLGTNLKNCVRSNRGDEPGDEAIVCCD